MNRNPIETLLETGFMADVMTAAKTGECYQFTGLDGISGPQPASAELWACRNRLAEAAASCGADVSMWFAVSPDRKRIMGEIVHHDGRDKPSVVWTLNADARSEPRLVYPRTVSVTFPSHIDLAEAVSDPTHLLRLTGHEQTEWTIGLLERLGYAVEWRSKNTLRHSVETLDLVAA